tara:strand:- start:9279 stop:9662 length:384 start_codon:yes stop_codon:yes gene_type:complete
MTISSPEKNAKVVESFINAWSRLDADELVAYFAEDGIYHNIPTEPVQGREALKAFIKNFISPWTKTQWDIISIVAEGNRVAVERLDRTVAADKQVDLPCFGMFELEDGKIKVWRDYFDLNTYIKGMS